MQHDGRTAGNTLARRTRGHLAAAELDDALGHHADAPEVQMLRECYLSVRDDIAAQQPGSPTAPR
jgi:hypothetical protein